MTSGDVTSLVIAAALVLVAAVLASAEAALSSMSRVRAEHLQREGRSGAARLTSIVGDAPRYLNTALLVRIVCEITAIVLVTLVAVDLLEPMWLQVLTAVGVMVVVSYVAVGVGPRTIGRQHSERVAL
ncbi:MAG: CNNM domain-containing protein, partial [Pseudonocardiaceae bacterium]